VVSAVLVVALEYTRFGAMVRAAVDNQRMARGLGINVDSAFAVTFALGSGLAGLGGALAIDIVGLDPSFALAYLVYVLIVVAVGGLGSIGGTFAAAMLLLTLLYVSSAALDHESAKERISREDLLRLNLIGFHGVRLVCFRA